MEYQIGNFVKYKGETVQVDNELLAKYLLNQLDEPFRPIRFNEQWLLRFGFRKQCSSFYVNGNFYISSLNFEHTGRYLFGNSRLEYFNYDICHVHEMQNAIAHINNTYISLNFDSEIQVLSAKLSNLSPLDQLIEILKKQIELQDDQRDQDYKVQQYELLTFLENLKSKVSY